MRDLVEQEYLQSLSIDEILDWFEAASCPWLDRSHPLHTKYDLTYLLHWSRSLRSTLDTSLRESRYTLDGVVDGLACFPRGVVVHWLAGNVPMLGMLSLLQALFTKNASLVKLPSTSPQMIPDLLASLAETSTEVDGERLLKSVATLSLDREDPRQKELSLAADVRIAWGGQEAVDAIRSLPCAAHCQDLIFGPRTSFAVVGAEEATGKIAGRVAYDVCQLQQRGCNSPHTLFVERGGGVSPEEFAACVAEGMEQHATRPLDLAAGQVGALLALRAEHEMEGGAFYPGGMGWSVLYSEEKGLAEPAHYRTLFVRPIDSVEEVVACCSAKTQTVGLALSPGRHKRLAYQLMQRGVDRCPPVGQMTLYDSPWDGFFVMDRLVRWCRLP